MENLETNSKEVIDMYLDKLRPELRKQLVKIYREDIDMFGYIYW